MSFALFTVQISLQPTNASCNNPHLLQVLFVRDGLCPQTSFTFAAGLYGVSLLRMSAAWFGMRCAR